MQGSVSEHFFLLLHWLVSSSKLPVMSEDFLSLSLCDDDLTKSSPLVSYWQLSSGHWSWLGPFLHKLGTLGRDGKHYLSSMSSVCSDVSFYLNVPRKTPEGSIQQTLGSAEPHEEAEVLPLIRAELLCILNEPSHLWLKLTSCPRLVLSDFFHWITRASQSQRGGQSAL